MRRGFRKFFSKALVTKYGKTMGKYVKMWMNGESIPYVLILILDLEQETIFMMTYPCLAIVNHHFPITNPWISNHFP